MSSSNRSKILSLDSCKILDLNGKRQVTLIRIAQVVSILACIQVTPLAFASTRTVVPSGVTPSITQQVDQSGQGQASGTLPSNVNKVGGKVLPPTVTYAVEPDFPKLILKGDVKGRVLLNLYVEANGRPSNVHVIRISLLDKKGKIIPNPEATSEGQDLARVSIDAVNQYRFKPATKDKTPVKVEINIEVSSPF